MDFHFPGGLFAEDGEHQKKLVKSQVGRVVARKDPANSLAERILLERTKEQLISQKCRCVKLLNCLYLQSEEYSWLGCQNGEERTTPYLNTEPKQAKILEWPNNSTVRAHVWKQPWLYHVSKAG